MGLAYLPNSWWSLAHPDDPRWQPLIMGLANGAFMFAVMFFYGTHARRFGNGEHDDLHELDAMATEEEEKSRQA